MRAPLPIALRDLALVAVTLAAWHADAALRPDAGAAAATLGVTAGVLAALCGYLAHEWGHLAGARAAGSTVQVAESPRSVFLFRFDSDRNRRGQFLAMSCGGFLASGLVVALFLAILPRDTLAGRVALGLTAAGVLATFVLEFPTAWRVARGAPLPRGAAYASAPPEP